LGVGHKYGADRKENAVSNQHIEPKEAECFIPQKS